MKKHVVTGPIRRLSQCHPTINNSYSYSWIRNGVYMETTKLACRSECQRIEHMQLHTTKLIEQVSSHPYRNHQIMSTRNSYSGLGRWQKQPKCLTWRHWLNKTYVFLPFFMRYNGTDPHIGQVKTGFAHSRTSSGIITRYFLLPCPSAVNSKIKPLVTKHSQIFFTLAAKCPVNRNNH